MTHRFPLVPALLTALPAVVGILYALAAATGVAGFAAEGFTGERIARVLGEAAIWRGLFWTLATAAAATLLAAAGAIILAVTFRGTATGDRTARALAVLPMAVPHLVAATIFVSLLGQSGVLVRLLVRSEVAPDLPGPLRRARRDLPAHAGRHLRAAA